MRKRHREFLATARLNTELCEQQTGKRIQYKGVRRSGMKHQAFFTKMTDK